MAFQPLNVNAQVLLGQNHSKTMQRYAINPVADSVEESVVEEKAQPINPFARKACVDCVYLRQRSIFGGLPSCESDEAYSARKTKYPDASSCPFWEPHYGLLSPENRKEIEQNGFKVPSLADRIGLLFLGKIF